MKKIMIAFFLFILGCNNDEIKKAEQKQKDSVKQVLLQQQKEIEKLKQEKITKDQEEKVQKEQAEIEGRKKEILNNINNYLFVKPEYPDPGFGGITNCKIHVQNRTPDVNFQKAIIQVQIILDNGNIYSNEFYPVENLEPGDLRTIDIPNTTRGTSVKAMVIKIKSSELTNDQLVDVNK
ncbi:MAG: hypothetical protein EKK37_15610 [Sphingobacteriales bacterium]|nr:MAG: hypothetical protein EKK37_15610 [Sphingobacteriales bacterium]